MSEQYQGGWLLQRDDGNFVTAIIANGHPENPVIYYSRDIMHAKPYYQIKMAEKRAQQLSLKIVQFRVDDKRQRVIECGGAT